MIGSKEYTLEEFKMRGNYVAVNPYEEQEELTKSGILVSESKKWDAWQNGRVISMGPGKKIEGIQTPMTVSIGDRVMFSVDDGETAHKCFTIDGKKCYIIPEDKLLVSFDWDD